MISLDTTFRKFVHDNILSGCDSGPFDDESSFLNTGLIDSAGVLELVAFIESNFGIQVHDDDLTPTNFDSIKNVSRFVETRMQECG